MRSSWIIWMGPKFNDKFPHRKHREEAAMWPLVPEMGEMLLPSKECQPPPEAGRGKEGFPLEPPNGV